MSIPFLMYLLSSDNIKESSKSLFKKKYLFLQPITPVVGQEALFLFKLNLANHIGYNIHYRF